MGRLFFLEQKNTIQIVLTYISLFNLLLFTNRIPTLTVIQIEFLYPTVEILEQGIHLKLEIKRHNFILFFFTSTSHPFQQNN